MIKKLHLLDYLIIILFVFLGVIFMNRVNNEFLTNADEQLYPASMTLLVYDRPEVLDNIKVDQLLSEDKTVAHGKIAGIQIVDDDDVSNYDLTDIISEKLVTHMTLAEASDTLLLQKITLKVDLTKKGLNYFLGNKEIKIGKTFVLESEFLYLNSKIIDFQLGDIDE